MAPVPTSKTGLAFPVFTISAFDCGQCWGAPSPPHPPGGPTSQPGRVWTCWSASRMLSIMISRKMFIWPFWLVAQWLKRNCLVFLFGGKENVTTSNFNIGFCSIPITAQILSLLRNYPRSRFPFLSKRCSGKPSHSVVIEHMPQYSFAPFEPWGVLNSCGTIFASHHPPWVAQIMSWPNPCNPCTFPLQQDGPWAARATLPLTRVSRVFHTGEGHLLLLLQAKATEYRLWNDRLYAKWEFTNEPCN